MLLLSSSASSCSRSHMAACSSASSASSFSSNVRLWLLINRAMLSAVCCCLFTFSLLRYWCLRPAVRHLVITLGDVTENYHTSPVVCARSDKCTSCPVPFFARFLLITGQTNPDCHIAKITLKRLRACSWADISTVMPICINPTGRSF